ncbi:MAG: hypothetical protein ACJ764_15290 [Solirubrobacteraceae bacterium]
MPHAKRLVTVLGTVTLLCGCSGVVKPPRGHGLLDSPLTGSPDRVACLRAAHLPVQVVDPTQLQIGPLPSGPTVKFEPTPGAAEALQIEGTHPAQGAELIGAALLYPHQASNSELTAIEDCLSVDVKEPKG